MVRVGVEESVSDALLKRFPREAEIVRIPAEPKREVEVEFWVAPMLPKTLASQFPHIRGMRVFQSLWAGVDLLLQLLPSEITLCDARGVHDIPTAEWVAAVILGMQKYLPFYGELQRQENWQGRWGAAGIYLQSHGLTAPINPPALVDEVADATVLVVGYGSIGQAVEARLAPFGAKFLRVARSAREGVDSVARLDELLPQADFVVLLLPLTEETRNLFDAGRLARMKHGALLVNAARGPVVDMEALLRALTEGRIRAAIDVTDPEPLLQGHPLWKAPNLLITPHVAGSSGKVLRRALTLAAEQVGRYVRGEPLLNVVTGDY